MTAGAIKILTDRRPELVTEFESLVLEAAKRRFEAGELEDRAKELQSTISAIDAGLEMLRAPIPDDIGDGAGPL